MLLPSKKNLPKGEENNGDKCKYGENFLSQGAKFCTSAFSMTPELSIKNLMNHICIYTIIQARTATRAATRKILSIYRLFTRVLIIHPPPPPVYLIGV